MESVLLVAYLVFIILNNEKEPDFTHGLLMVIDVIFVLDMLMRIVAYRFRGKYSFLSSNSNILELVINLVTFVSWFTKALSRISRAVRACRILRIVPHYKQITILVISITKSAKMIARLIFLLFVFILFVACLTVKMFKGATYACTSPDIHTKK